MDIWVASVSWNNVAMNTRLHISFELEFSPDACPRVGLLDPAATLEAFILLSIVTIPVYLSTTVEKCSFFSTLSSAFIIFRLFKDGHSDWCEVMPP